MPFLGNWCRYGSNAGYKDWLRLNDKISLILSTCSATDTSSNSSFFLADSSSSVAVDMTCNDSLRRAAPCMLS